MTSLGLAFAAAVVSGASALVYEVVWLRTLSLVVGHAVDALTAVLAAYMAGLAVGALLFGRLAERLRRPLLTCAHAERALAREPGEPQALFFAGVASWWLGRKDDAQRYLERATALEPQNVEFRGALARLRGGTLSR